MLHEVEFEIWLVEQRSLNGFGYRTSVEGLSPGWGHPNEDELASASPAAEEYDMVCGYGLAEEQLNVYSAYSTNGNGKADQPVHIVLRALAPRIRHHPALGRLETWELPQLPCELHMLGQKIAAQGRRRPGELRNEACTLHTLALPEG